MKFNQDVIIRHIPGYEGLYSATSDGRIIRHARKRVKQGFVKLRTNTVYMRVPLWKDGLQKWESVHRLVALAFIPNPLNKPQVNHKNSNKHDNKVENLEWVTWRENWQHARDNGAYSGKMLSETEQKELYQLYAAGNVTRTELVKQFGVSLSSVGRHINKWKEILN